MPGIVLLCVAPGSPLLSDSADFSPEDLRRMEQQVHQYVNQERFLNRKPKLNWNEELAAEARRHAGRLAGGSLFSHVDPSRGDIDARLDQSGIDWRRCAENLYEGNIGDPATEAVRSWFKSAGHRKNMLNSKFNEAGVGVAVRGNGMIVIVQDYVLQ
jgi:uncharacterized protein YkwD